MFHLIDVQDISTQKNPSPSPGGARKLSWCLEAARKRFVMDTCSISQLGSGKNQADELLLRHPFPSEGD